MGMTLRMALAGACLVVLAALGTAVPATAQQGGVAALASTARAVAATATGPSRQSAGSASGAAPSSASSTAARCAAGLVALTFDDGPARGLTAKLVGLLQQRHVPATFFMVGSRVRTAPGAARIVARAGFTVGNHTWSHPRLTRLSDEAVRSELRRTARELRRTGIRPSTLMRPPYGDIDARVRADVRALGLVPVLWTVDSEDWRGGSARQIAHAILAQLRPHGTNIVLQHDGVTNSPASVAAVPLVIRAARQRGYCFAALGPRGHPVLPVSTAPGQVASDRAVGLTSAYRVALKAPFGATVRS